MTFETKRGYKVILIGKEIIITCPDFKEAQFVYNSLLTQCMIGKLKQRWGLIRKRD